jgi:hypothetical protein
VVLALTIAEVEAEVEAEVAVASELEITVRIPVLLADVAVEEVDTMQVVLAATPHLQEVEEEEVMVAEVDLVGGGED